MTARGATITRCRVRDNERRRENLAHSSSFRVLQSSLKYIEIDIDPAKVNVRKMRFTKVSPQFSFLFILIHYQLDFTAQCRIIQKRSDFKTDMKVG